mgnify:CR=1 FL=1
MSKDQEREAFEHYFSDGGKSPRSVERGADGKYLLGSAHNAWRVWQASRAAMAPAGEPVARSARRVSVDSGAIAMVLNALRRDATEGKASRQEMVDELEATISPAPDRAEVLRLADEMARKAWASASSFDRRMQDEARKYEEDEKASRAALVRLLGVE